MSTNANPEPEADQQELFNAVESDLREVPLDAIEPTPDTGNTSLENAISNLGTVSTPILQLDEDTDEYGYRIVDGRRRIAALREQEQEEVTAHVVPPSMDAEADALTATMNIVRDPNPMEEARAIASLLDQGYTPESLSRIGIPKQTTKKRMRLWQCPDPIKEGVEEGEIAEGTAESVANLSPDLQQKCVRHYQTEDQLRGQDVTEIRQTEKKREAEDLEQKEVFDTPDVSRSTPSSGATEDDSSEEVESPSSSDSFETGVEIPSDKASFKDYIMIAGAVRTYLMGDKYDTTEEAVQGAVALGTKNDLTPEEVIELLRTPPEHFLSDEAAAIIEEQLSS